jgi:hypothetical protein
LPQLDPMAEDSAVAAFAGSCDKTCKSRASVELCKIYTTVPDAIAPKLGMLRVVDESGEDYLYPADQTDAIELPSRIAKVIAPSRTRPSKS